MRAMKCGLIMRTCMGLDAHDGVGEFYHVGDVDGSVAVQVGTDYRKVVWRAAHNVVCNSHYIRYIYCIVTVYVAVTRLTQVSHDAREIFPLVGRLVRIQIII